MDGQPVWLCSVSRRDKNHSIIATGDWKPKDFAFAERLARAALRDVGDEYRERAFRMNITFCIHRGISTEEEKSLPPAWCTALGGLAGGPIEVLWSKGIPHKLAAMPCENPGQHHMFSGRSDLFVPLDCKVCPPCLERLKIEEGIDHEQSLRGL